MSQQSGKSKSRFIAILATTILLLVLVPMIGLFGAMFSGDAAGRWGKVNDVILDRIAVTVILAVTVMVISVLIALPFALALRRARFFGQNLLRVLYVMPLLIPAHIQGIAWMRVMGRQGNLTAWLVENFGYELNVRAGWLELGGKPIFFPGAIWMLVAAFWPVAALIISAGLARLDPRAEEAALFVPTANQGNVSRGSRIWRAVSRGRWFLFLFDSAHRKSVDGILLPLLKPHIMAGAFFVFIFAAGCYPIPALLDTPTIMIDIFFIASQVDSAAAGVASAPLVLITVLALVWISVGSRGDVFQSRSRPVANPGSLRPRNRLLGAYAWGLVALTSFVPLYALLEKAGGLETYQSIWKNVHKDINNSFKLALVGAIVVAIGGTVVALYASRLDRKRGFVVELLALLPFAFPAIVVGVAMNE
ncbi:MAG: ABC-type Fe3+ transport system permease subunit, partial [Planctomycetota bacterium]